MKRFALGLLCLLHLAPLSAEPLGRLFFTPAQRATLDLARQQARSVRVVDEDDASPPAAGLTLNGVIVRSDGQATVWVNNRALDGKRLPQGAALDGVRAAEGGIGVKLPGGRPVPLKVGQSLDLGSGRIEEGYRRPQARLKEPADPAGSKAGAEPSPVPAP
ncbi:MAG: hypothetical protein AB1710_03145 [Pseudomonadota bacterium]|jgi:hypothetical protein